MTKILTTVLVYLIAFKCSNCLRFDLVSDEQNLVETQKVHVKQGFCPRQFNQQKVCKVTCNSDSDCPGPLKCCLTDCSGSVCVKPEEDLIFNRNAKLAALDSDLVARCPALSTHDKTVKTCVECHSGKDCDDGQLCCRVNGCAKRSCVNANLNPKPIANIGRQQKSLTVQVPAYDDYYSDLLSQINPHDYYTNYKLQQQLDPNRLSAGNPANTFEGPLVNLIGSAKTPYLYRQKNPFYKLEKQQYLNSQLPRYNVHPMALKMIRNGVY